MPSSRYALVTYVRNPVGEFVTQLRRELHPTLPHMPAHLTILPPRELIGSESAALEFLEEACSHAVPFSVELGDVDTFLPTTPTVFIQVRRAAYRCANCTIDSAVGAALRRRLALHSASHHSESGDRRTGSRSLRRRTRALGRVSQQPRGACRGTCVRPREWRQLAGLGAAGAGTRPIVLQGVIPATRSATPPQTARDYC